MEEEKMLEVLRLASSGDKAAFNELAIHFEKVLKAIGRHFLDSSFDIEDALQDTWVKILKYYCTLRDPLKFPCWAAQIMRHSCINKLKDRKKKTETANLLSFEMSHDLIDCIINEDNISKYTENAALKKIIGSMLESMPESYALPFRLYYLESMRIKDIERLMGLSNSAVKWRLHHGRNIFKKHISERLKDYYI